MPKNVKFRTRISEQIYDKFYADLGQWEDSECEKRMRKEALSQVEDTR